MELHNKSTFMTRQMKVTKPIDGYKVVVNIRDKPGDPLTRLTSKKVYASQEEAEQVSTMIVTSGTLDLAEWEA